MIYLTHKRFLYFTVNNNQFQYIVLPFGLSSSPRIFSNIMVVAAAHLHQLEIIVFLISIIGYSGISLTKRFYQQYNNKVSVPQFRFPTLLWKVHFDSTAADRFHGCIFGYRQACDPKEFHFKDSHNSSNLSKKLSLSIRLYGSLHLRNPIRQVTSLMLPRKA